MSYPLHLVLGFNIAHCRCRVDARIFLRVGDQDLYLAAAKTVAVWTPPYIA
jgi:hypothetical protein